MVPLGVDIVVVNGLIEVEFVVFSFKKGRPWILGCGIQVNPCKMGL